MLGLLDLFVARQDDRAAKCWVAKALVEAFPDPRSETDFTHARAALVPIHAELEAMAAATVGKELPMHGRITKEPLLACCVTVARTKFVWTADIESRKALFKALIEIVASNPNQAKERPISDVATALRIEMEDLESDPAARGPVEAFECALDLIPWMKEQRERYQAYVIASWGKIAPILQDALLDPIGVPDGSSIDGGWEDGMEFPLGEGRTDSDLQPSGYFKVPEPVEDVERRRSPKLHERIVQSGLSTATPLVNFSDASATWLFDVEIEQEIKRLSKRFLDARGSDNALEADRALLRLLSLATATPVELLRDIEWGTGVSATRYPGVLEPNGRWLRRPELHPGDPKGQVKGELAIPIPPVLAEYLTTSRNVELGAMVFPLLRGETERKRLERLHVSDTALWRALFSRLAQREPLGISLAQLVSGNTAGIDTAPLFYDQTNIHAVAWEVANITFPWFGAKSTKMGKAPISGNVGSRRVPSKSSMRAFMKSLREDFVRAEGDELLQLRHRIRYVVHGLALCTGHRPNDGFTRLHRWSFSTQDPLGILADKEVAADWLVRPIVTPERWREEFAEMLKELARLRAQFPGTSFSESARKALDGTGPVFLDVHSTDDVSAFGRDAYLEGLPSDLRDLANFARQSLNSALTAMRIKEALRVGQMGWHGTREGAWADGSPWSVLSAARSLLKPLHEVLKDLGWSRLRSSSGKEEEIALQPLDWIAAYHSHEKRFRLAIQKGKADMEICHEEVRTLLIPRLRSYLANTCIGLTVDQNRAFVHKPLIRLNRGHPNNITQHRLRQRSSRCRFVTSN